MANKSFARMTVDHWSEVAKGIAYLGDNRVMVGIPAATSMREDGESISNAALGYIHEHGAPEANIPPRPFLRPAINEAQSEIRAALKLAGQTALAGNAAAAERALEAVGRLAQNKVMAKINSNIPPPLAKRTLAARKRQGIRSERTLIRTGELRNAITYVIRSRLTGADRVVGPKRGQVNRATKNAKA